MAIETIQKDGIVYAILARKPDLEVKETQFFTPNDATLQMGVTTHEAGYIERPHYHKPNDRKVTGTYETLQLTRGSATMDFYDKKKFMFKSVDLKEGDLMLLLEGIHRIRTNTGYSGVKVKQGPYISIENDKVSLDE